MSSTAALTALAFAALQLFAAGLALHSTLSDGLTRSAGLAAAQASQLVAYHAPPHR